SSKKPSIYIHHKKAKPLIQKWFPNSTFSQLPSFSNWTVLDSDFTQNEIKLHGISTAGDTLPRLINVFKNVNPAENLLGSISPLNSTGFYSVTFKDFKQLSENLKTLQGNAKPEGSKELDLLQNSVEAGMIYTSEASVFAVRIPGNEFASTFSNDLNLAESFRETSIFEYPKPKVFADLLKPLLKPENLKYFAVLDQFAIFSESDEALKEVISAFQNE
ncbi:hypothetical protein, partial [Longispora fulva]|uniref:hypothetical protein n=2 Tax=Bacteria TaxID=2 RepID=UPI003627ED80